MDERMDTPSTPEPSASLAAPPVAQTQPAAPAQPVVVMQPPRGRSIFWGVVSGCLIVFVLLTVGSVLLAVWRFEDHDDLLMAGAKIAIIPVEGEIVDSKEIIEWLHDYVENDSVKAMVVRINSPGGAVAPSQEIFEEIRKLRAESGKPIVASMDSIAASGGYYIAVACDTIVANPGSITGSIGVIAQWFNVEDLLHWARLRPETITSGPMKDAGSPYRPLTAVEKEYFQQIVQQLHGQFVVAVAEGRKGKLTLDEVKGLADGRVFTGQEAKRLKLVDELGNLQDAIATAAKLAGMKGKPKTVYPRKNVPGLLEILAGMKSPENILREVAAKRTAPLYRW